MKTRPKKAQGKKPSNKIPLYPRSWNPVIDSEPPKWEKDISREEAALRLSKKLEKYRENKDTWE